MPYTIDVVKPLVDQLAKFATLGCKRGRKEYRQLSWPPSRTRPLCPPTARPARLSRSRPGRESAGPPDRVQRALQAGRFTLALAS
jgi:hypothetical protein